VPRLFRSREERDDDEDLIVTGYVHADRSMTWIVHRPPWLRVLWLKLKWRLLNWLALHMELDERSDTMEVTPEQMNAMMAAMAALTAALQAKSAPAQTSAQIDAMAGGTTLTSSVVQGMEVDAVVQPGTPGTVMLPTTGNVLSLPYKDKEGIMSYAVRVSAQCGCDPTKAIGMMGSLIYAQGPIYFPDGSAHADWPTVVDAFFNHDAYFPQSAAQRSANQAAWVAVGQGIAQQGAAPAPASVGGNGAAAAPAPAPVAGLAPGETAL
jgi:hypothetical protein